MMKIRYVLALALAVFIAISAMSCGAVDESLETSVDETIPEDNILHVQGRINELTTIEEIYDYADYLVVCEVTSKGTAFLMSGELDTTLPQNEIMEALTGLRTPYEITVIESFKGDLEAGDTFTVLDLQGTLNGYAVDCGLPVLEVGSVYLMPICIAAEDEVYSYSPALVKIDAGVSALSADSQSSADIEPLMFETAYSGIDNYAELVSAITAVSE